MLEPTEPATKRTPQPLRGNLLLDALPASERERLTPAVRRVFLQRDQVIANPGDPLAHLHFPIDAFCWTWDESTKTGRPTPVTTAGHRGVLEIERILGFECAHGYIKVISAGSAWRLSAEAFDRYNSAAGSPLRRILLRYAFACIANTAAALACNSEHNVDQRLARWLLWVSDEAGPAEFTMTHQQIAEIAAIRRPSISLELSNFQRIGLLRSAHGRLQILDRAGLERIVCPCYWSMRHNTESAVRYANGPS